MFRNFVETVFFSPYLVIISSTILVIFEVLKKRLKVTKLGENFMESPNLVKNGVKKIALTSKIVPRK